MQFPSAESDRSREAPALATRTGFERSLHALRPARSTADAPWRAFASPSVSGATAKVTAAWLRLDVAFIAVNAVVRCYHRVELHPDMLASDTSMRGHRRDTPPSSDSRTLIVRVLAVQPSGSFRSDLHVRQTHGVRQVSNSIDG